MLKGLNNGALSPYEYARILDYKSLAHKEEKDEHGKTTLVLYQTYGTYSTKGKLHPVFDPENINDKRAAVGLEPIEDYARKLGLKWD